MTSTNKRDEMFQFHLDFINLILLNYQSLSSDLNHEQGLAQDEGVAHEITLKTMACPHSVSRQLISGQLWLVTPILALKHNCKPSGLFCLVFYLTLDMELITTGSLVSHRCLKHASNDRP